MKSIKIILASLMFASAILVVSCKKSDTATDNDTTGAGDAALSENTSNDIVQMGAETTDNMSAGLSNYRLSSPEQTLAGACATYAWDTTGGNRSVTVTFSGACKDGRTRSGSLTYNYAGSPAGAHYRTPGFTYTVTSNNYVVDGNQVNIINKTVTNTTPVGFDSSKVNETWTISANINIVKANGTTVSWICNRTKTLLNTSTTYNGPNIPINWPDARVGITGSASGSRSGGETFTIDVTSQLVRDFTCTPLGLHVHPFILGTLTYTPSTKKYPRYVDYGAPNNGGCDMIADVTINGTTYQIILP